MKKLFLTVALIAGLFITAQAQTKTDSLKIDSNISIFGNVTPGQLALSNNHWQTFKVIKDTVACYFQVITGIVKGNLMGTWIKGWVVKPKKSVIFIQDVDYEDYREKYLYPDKKTLVKKPIINHYTANE